MKTNKKGFTLSEVLVAITIIGVVMAFSVQTLKILRSSYSALAFFALKNVKNIVQEASNGVLSSDGTHYNTTMLCKQRNADGYTKVTAILNPDIFIDEKDERVVFPSCKMNPTEKAKYNKDAAFCKYVASVVNTAGETYCDLDTLYEPKYDSATGEPYIESPNGDGNFSNSLAQPNFVTTNGQRYFLSKHTYNENVSTDFGYRLLAVDLNGKSRPNISDKANSNKPPDVITFLILDNGEVYPLGVAADNIEVGDGRIVQYINAKLKSYYFNGAYFDGSTVHGISRTRDNIAEACFATIRSKEEKENQLCNFSVIYQKNKNKGKDSNSSFFSYRQAYCGAMGNSEPTFANYCAGIEKNEYCPPSANDQQFDLCLVETVKPMFRYDMR